MRLDLEFLLRGIAQVLRYMTERDWPLWEGVRLRRKGTAVLAQAVGLG